MQCWSFYIKNISPIALQSRKVEGHDLIMEIGTLKMDDDAKIEASKGTAKRGCDRKAKKDDRTWQSHVIIFPSLLCWGRP